MQHRELEKMINRYLESESFQDYAPNGLQVEGREEVLRIITGVTACQALLDAAVTHQADAVLVHHGYFWKNEAPVIRGIKRQRLKTLLMNDINLYAYHLPLDAHSVLGNNALLAQALDIQIKGHIAPLLPYGELSQPMTATELAQRIYDVLGREALHCGDNAPSVIHQVAWCSGGGQDFIEAVAEFGVDAFITGEVSEKTIHIAREYGIHFFAAGHHATERAGIKALGEWLRNEHGMDVVFVDIPNPV